VWLFNPSDDTSLLCLCCCWCQLICEPYPHLKPYELCCCWNMGQRFIKIEIPVPVNCLNLCEGKQTRLLHFRSKVAGTLRAAFLKLGHSYVVLCIRQLMKLSIWAQDPSDIVAANIECDNSHEMWLICLFNTLLFCWYNLVSDITDIILELHFTQWLVKQIGKQMVHFIASFHYKQQYWLCLFLEVVSVNFLKSMTVLRSSSCFVLHIAVMWL